MTSSVTIESALELTLCNLCLTLIGAVITLLTFLRYRYIHRLRTNHPVPPHAVITSLCSCVTIQTRQNEAADSFQGRSAQSIVRIHGADEGILRLGMHKQSLVGKTKTGLIRCHNGLAAFGAAIL